MYDLRQNSVLAEEFHAVGAARFGMIKTDQEGAIGGSTGRIETALLPLYSYPLLIEVLSLRFRQRHLW